MKTAPFLIAGIFLAGCSSADDMAEDLGQTPEAQASASAGAKAEAEAQSAATTSLSRESDGYTLEYSWPAVVTDYPELVDRFRTQATMIEGELELETDRARKDAEENEFPFRKYGHDHEWEVIGDTPDWLSLKARISTYSGGAHPNSGYDGLVWSKKGKSALEPLDFFRSAGNLEQAVRRRFCELLDGERARRRGQLVTRDSDDPFEQCPGIDELTVLLRSTNGKNFNKVGLIAAPYIAGPYAEGPYEFTLSVDTSVLDAVKPEYVQHFELAR